ncbi:hypothetical protein, partial [Actinacidiphila rubida]
CPADCGRTRAPRQYLCRDCWFQLPRETRRLLTDTGHAAVDRLRQLLDQIHAGVPLPDIRLQ